MGDFLLDFRPGEQRRLDQAASFLRFFPDIRVERFEEQEFGLVLTSPGDPHLWAPFRSPDGSVLVALCGRIALDQREWDEAGRAQGSGGLACRYIFQCYSEAGISKVCDLNGNFVILIFDRSRRRLFLITDRWGLLPAFKSELTGTVAFSSHPDALADAIGESRNLDLTSLAEFILVSKLSPPYTYYERIKALAQASVTSIVIAEDGATVEFAKPYFDFPFTPYPEEKVNDLAAELAVGIRSAVSKRTLPLLGKCALALSGGLDSRTVLCASPHRDELAVFCFFDEENRELRTARAIARAAGVELIPFRRHYEYYGDSAELGVRISGGMACIGSNHFLGFRSALQDLGAENLLTGCYCDYVFKGWNLNKSTNRWTRRETLANFNFEYYSRHFPVKNHLWREVEQRLESLFPVDLRRYDTQERVFKVEFLRDFPLYYEEDSAGRVILERVMPWHVFMAENSLMAVYLKMTAAMRMNRRLFGRAVQAICDPQVARIPDSNTGAPVNAGVAREAVSSHVCRLANRLRRLRASNATTGSWLNWEFYLHNSDKIRSLWERPNREAEDVFCQVLGKENFSSDLRAYQGDRLQLLMRLLTLKLWFDQRAQSETLKLEGKSDIRHEALV